MLDWLEVVAVPKVEGGGGKFLVFSDSTNEILVVGFCSSYEYMCYTFRHLGGEKAEDLLLIGGGTLDSRGRVEKWKVVQLGVETPVAILPEIDGLVAKHRRQVLNARNGF